MKERMFIVGIVTTFAASLILSSIILSRSITTKHAAEHSIRVTGTARRIVRSDYIIWTATVSYEAPTLSGAYQNVQAGIQKLNAYLKARGIGSNEIFPLAINTTTLYAKTLGAGPNDQSDASTFRTVEGYRMAQDVEIRSNNVHLVEGVSQTVTELINQGVSLQTSAPQY